MTRFGAKRPLASKVLAFSACNNIYLNIRSFQRPAQQESHPVFHSIRKNHKNSLKWRTPTQNVAIDSVQHTLSKNIEIWGEVSFTKAISATFHPEKVSFPTKDTGWFAGSVPKYKGLCKNAITWEKVIHLHPKTHQHVGKLMHFLPVAKSSSVLQCLCHFLDTAIRRHRLLGPPKLHSRHVENWWYVRPTLGLEKIEQNRHAHLWAGFNIKFDARATYPNPGALFSDKKQYFRRKKSKSMR